MSSRENKDLAEQMCVGRFLNFINFSQIIKNPIENEIDIYFKDENNYELKFQIVSADPPFYGEVGKHITARRKGLVDEKCFTRGNENALNIINPIKKKIELYRKQGVDMSDIILLLDDGIGDMPSFILEEVKNSNTEILCNSGFKEIWYVGNVSKFKFI